MPSLEIGNWKSELRVEGGELRVTAGTGKADGSDQRPPGVAASVPDAWGEGNRRPPETAATTLGVDAEAARSRLALAQTAGYDDSPL